MTDDDVPEPDGGVPEPDGGVPEPDGGVPEPGRERAAGRPTGWQPPEPTGVAAVDQAVDMLTELDSLPSSEHVAHYESAHRRLQDALADLDGA